MSAFFDNLTSNSPLIMGILNVTPDSFSDGGDYNSTALAVAHGLKLLGDGAHILDIGGESTRPNADVVSVKEEIERVVPVIRALATHAPYISIDTRNAATMRAAIDAGANIINDVSALSHDPESMIVASQSGLPVCLMHMKGSPKDMQKSPSYDDVVVEVLNYFKARIIKCIEAGIDPSQIIIDPGIGFGKTLEHNFMLIKHISAFQSLGHPVLLGASRKSFIGALDINASEGKDRIAGSIAAALYGVFHGGAQIIRVHDVYETRQALAVFSALSSI